MNRYVRLEPLFPIADTDCGEHGVELPCPKCAVDGEFYSDLAQAEQWERNAKRSEQILLSSPSDRDAVQSWIDHCWKEASAIRGRLQRHADREAREDDNHP